MIITFSVQNFHSIRDKITLDFRATSDKHQEEYFVVEIPKPKMRILKMAMIYGANASGKTNILLALDFLRDFILSKKEDKDQAIPFESYALDRKQHSSFELLFYHDGILYDYALLVNKFWIISEKLSHYPNGKEALVFERTVKDNDPTSYSYSWRGAKLEIEQKKDLELSLHNQSILARINKIRYTGPIQDARNWFSRSLHQLVRPNTPLFQFSMNRYAELVKEDPNWRSFYLDLMQKADLSISDLILEEKSYRLSELSDTLRKKLDIFLQESGYHIEKEGIVEEKSLKSVHISDGKEFQISFSDESIGTHRYFGYIGVLIEFLTKNSVIAIDEIESSLHNDLLFHFIAMFLKNAKQGQLIFTSHNTALLNEREIIRRDCIWITDRKDDGSTELTSVSDYPVRKEHAIDSLFKKGLIGGKPNLGSIEVEDLYGQKQS